MVIYFSNPKNHLPRPKMFGDVQILSLGMVGDYP